MTKIKNQLTFGTDLSGEIYDTKDPSKIKFQPSKNLEFLISPEPLVEQNRIQVVGTLMNHSEKPENIIVFPVAGVSPMHLTLKLTNTIQLKKSQGPPVPPVPPPPMVIKVPGKSSVRFDGQVNLLDYLYAGAPTAEVEWTFHYWNEPRPSGKFNIKLPKK